MKIFRKPYVYFVIGIFLLYLFLNFLLSGFYNTLPLIIIYAATINWFKLGISLVLTPAIGILVSINSVLAYIKYKERKNCRGEATVTGIGAAGGLATGVCPLCVAGLFPLAFGFFGVSFSFASLPLQGIEVQLFVLIILLISYRQLLLA